MPTRAGRRSFSITKATPVGGNVYEFTSIEPGRRFVLSGRRRSTI